MPDREKDLNRLLPATLEISFATCCLSPNVTASVR